MRFIKEIVYVWKYDKFIFVRVMAWAIGGLLVGGFVLGILGFLLAFMVACTVKALQLFGLFGENPREMFGEIMGYGAGGALLLGQVIGFFAGLVRGWRR